MTPLEQVFREVHGRAVAVLTRQLGDLDLAEEAVAEAYAAAAATWPDRGVPPSPAGWVITTARNKAVDRLRREAVGTAKLAEVARLAAEPEVEEVGAVRDDQLRLLFTCCHPALAPDARVALTLRMVGGLTTAEIARGFLVPEPTMAARITRAKHKIARARIPYRVPTAADLPARLTSVLAVVHLVGTEAHAPATGDAGVRDDLLADAVRLARLLVELVPEEPECRGLLALLLLTAARRPARVDDDGALVPLDRQDRGRWSRPLVEEGQALVRECLRARRPGPYQVQAAIAAVHADAPTWADTDWSQVVALYDQLPPTPVVQLNRAVAVAELDGPSVGLALVDRVDLDRSPVLHAVRADLLRRLGRVEEARSAYDAALARSGNAAERADLHRRRAALS
ncbi:RNA polymerase sigma factor [Klenkia sp. PcliD-1-E]|uniref:RNA polymerase sigma factor n=1 Tax=Klenkia sp. PcliD-1-E TaxID=2954492 RepID=UPI002096964F|nr:sigma-70 family RNA polymerase sigma factor [Klenkia sp. PcliD-1-E]MCO7218632.1 sigma-70 family RNA polymerase sigma factor [Klenkia sp. PcliD-1-E]